ncbi:hypothetical protein Tco_0969219 [Tanacetum coccineum]
MWGATLERKSTTGGRQFLEAINFMECKNKNSGYLLHRSEYVADARCCGQVFRFRITIVGLWFPILCIPTSTLIMTAHICIVKNPVYHSKTKHIEIRHHFIRDSYEKKLIRVEKIHTDFNVADLLTKAFDGPRFKSGRPILILIPLRRYTIPEASVTTQASFADGFSGFLCAHNTKIVVGDWGIWGIQNVVLYVLETLFHTPMAILGPSYFTLHKPKRGGNEIIGSNIMATALICFPLNWDGFKPTKQNLGNAIVTLVKKVRRTRKVVKSRRVVLTDSEDGAAENSSKQGRNLQKHESEVFETPKQGKSSGEIDISPQDIKSASENSLIGGEHCSCYSKRRTTVLNETPLTTTKPDNNQRRAARLAEIARIHAEDEAKHAGEKTLTRPMNWAAQKLEAGQEDWDTIRAKLEANVDLVKEIAGEDVSEADYAQRMVGSAKDSIGHIFTASGWIGIGSISSYRYDLKVNFGVFDETPWKGLCLIDTRSKERRKCTGAGKDCRGSLNLQSLALRKMLKPTWRKDEPSSEEFSMSSIPQGLAPAKIVKWLIIKTGKRGVVRIILDSCLYQQQILNWRYFHSCNLHCLTMEAAHIFMLTEVKYPLPPRVCKAMLEKKLLGNRKDEVCYQLLKLIERQAQQQ